MPTRLTAAALAGRKILVVGEAILDRYVSGAVNRVSREAPVPVISEPQTSIRCGGAANAAASVAALGSQATLVAVSGDDGDGEQLARACVGAGIQTSFVAQGATRTAVKTRFMSSGQQLLRVDDCPALDEFAGALADRALELLDGHEVLLLSDYGFGALQDARQIVAAARERGMPVVVDPRGPDWSRYAGASLVTPNLEEFELAGRGGQADDGEAARTLMAEHRLDAVLVTAGSQGMTLHEPDRAPLRLPTHAVEVYDVTGAGDTVAAVLALGLAAGAQPEEASRWANTAAGVVVGKPGAATVSAAELTAGPAGHGGRIVELAELEAELGKARALGKSVVMTNGCFDIVHAGHLDTLAAAARHGDILVVGVNDDASVSALKGPTRPVMGLAERMQLLAGIGYVDYVCAFSGPEATAMAKAVAPDVYVKGGDWEERPPNEAQAVEQLGGSVVYHAVRPDISTTVIIDRIKNTDAD